MHHNLWCLMSKVSVFPSQDTCKKILELHNIGRIMNVNGLRGGCSWLTLEAMIGHALITDNSFCSANWNENYRHFSSKEAWIIMETCWHLFLSCLSPQFITPCQYITCLVIKVEIHIVAYCLWIMIKQSSLAKTSMLLGRKWPFFSKNLHATDWYSM